MLMQFEKNYMPMIVLRGKYSVQLCVKKEYISFLPVIGKIRVVEPVAPFSATNDNVIWWDPTDSMETSLVYGNVPGEKDSFWVNCS